MFLNVSMLKIIQKKDDIFWQVNIIRNSNFSIHSKGLLKYSHAHLFIHCFFSSKNTRVKKWQPKSNGSQSLERLLFGTLKKKFADSWSRRYSDDLDLN